MHSGIWRGIVALHPLGRPQSHASSLLIHPDGTALVAWFAGSHEGAPDTRIVLARGRLHAPRGVGVSADFSSVRVVAGAPTAHWNPVLAHGSDGRTWLFFHRGPRIDTWTTWVCHSSDAGLTWDEPTELVPGEHSRGPVRQAPLRHGPLWLAPGSVEDWSDPPRWDCFVDLSSNDGASWQRVDLPLDHRAVRGAGAIQPALAALPDGRLVALARSSGGWALRSETRDPWSWPPLEPCGLPNNNSGLAVIPLAGERLACVHNPASEDWGARCPLVVSVSADAGHTWRQAVVLDAGGGRSPGLGAPLGAAATGVVTSGDGEYSYPSVVRHDGALWISYTWQRRGIALARVPLSMLESGPASRPAPDPDRPLDPEPSPPPPTREGAP